MQLVSLSISVVISSETQNEIFVYVHHNSLINILPSISNIICVATYIRICILAKINKSFFAYVASCLICIYIPNVSGNLRHPFSICNQNPVLIHFSNKLLPLLIKWTGKLISYPLRTSTIVLPICRENSPIQPLVLTYMYIEWL